MRQKKPRSQPIDAGRTIAFSDGVVAIAITLLILPLTDIELPNGAAQENPLYYVWINNQALILSFLLTWIVIITFWLSHHRTFALFDKINGSIMGWNIVWLFGVIILPFPMNLLNQVESGSSLFDADRQVVGAYIGTMFVISFSLTMIYRQALVDPRLATAEAAPGIDKESMARSAFIPAYMAVLVLVAILWPTAALYGLIGLAFMPNLGDVVIARYFKDRPTDSVSDRRARQAEATIDSSKSGPNHEK